MSPDRSVSYWIHQLKEGDRDAAYKLWERYFHRLVTLARQKLHGCPRRFADEEDVALSAFDSFYRRAEQGCFPRLNDRDDLWLLLVLITERKAIDLRQYEGRQGRDWHKQQPLSANGHAEASHLVGREPDPAFAAQVAEECRRLLELLPSSEMQQITLHKMEGHTSQEIAALRSCSRATVERRLQIIRKIWEQEIHRPC